MKTKACSACHEEKPLSEYHSTGWYKRKDGTRTKSLKPDCKECANKKWRSRFHELLISLNVVWKCERCGYDKCIDALDFHHKDPTVKEFAISSRWTISKELLTKEINKCTILCSNCHRELHAGLWNLGV